MQNPLGTIAVTRRIGRSISVLVASAAIVLALAACSSDPGTATAAPAGGSPAAHTVSESTAAGPTGESAAADPIGESASQTYDDWDYAYQKCLRAAGFDMSAGIKMDMSGGTLKASPEYEAANAACLKEVGQAPSVPGAPGTAEMQASMLAFAKCMRQAGYDYPDPDFAGTGGWTVERIDPKVIDPDDAAACTAAAYARGGDGTSGDAARDDFADSK